MRDTDEIARSTVIDSANELRKAISHLKVPSANNPPWTVSSYFLPFVSSSLASYIPPRCPWFQLSIPGMQLGPGQQLNHEANGACLCPKKSKPWNFFNFRSINIWLSIVACNAGYCQYLQRTCSKRNECERGLYPKQFHKFTNLWKFYTVGMNWAVTIKIAKKKS